MKLLLTSAGIKNTEIHNALVDLLEKPIAERRALGIPTLSPKGIEDCLHARTEFVVPRVATRRTAQSRPNNKRVNWTIPH